MAVPSTPDHADAAAPGYAARLWAAGLATAVVAGLVALAGASLAAALLDVQVLSVEVTGTGWSATTTYVVAAAGLAVLLTAVLHLLLAAVPRPVAYFRWIVALVGVVLVAVPFAFDAPVAAQVATAVVSGLVVIAIGSLLGAQGRLVERARARSAVA